MEILVRNNGENKWEKAREKVFESEAALQNVLYQSPEIMPIEKLGQKVAKPRLFVKEAGLPGSGSTDLIGIDHDGGITIIECKLATNSDIRRKVIGQVFEYAAYLWGMTYDEFDNICSKAEKWVGKHLADVMREIMEQSGESWSEEVFRDGISSSLEKGDFRLIIAVDSLSDELRRIIEFLNSRGEFAPRIYALELRQFATSQLQMLVPELFGPSQALSPHIPSIKDLIEAADAAVRPKLEKLHDALISRFKLIPRPTRRTISYDLTGTGQQRGTYLIVWPKGFSPSASDTIAVQIGRQLIQQGGGDPDMLYQRFNEEGLRALPPSKSQQTLLIDRLTNMDKWLELLENCGLPDLLKHG